VESKPEVQPEESVASFAPLRMRFAVDHKLECATGGNCISTSLNINPFLPRVPKWGQ